MNYFLHTADTGKVLNSKVESYSLVVTVLLKMGCVWLESSQNRVLLISQLLLRDKAEESGAWEWQWEAN